MKHTCENYLTEIRATNPALFSAARIAMSPEKLAEAIARAWQRGHDDALRQISAQPKTDIPDFLQGLFKKH